MVRRLEPGWTAYSMATRDLVGVFIRNGVVVVSLEESTAKVGNVGDHRNTAHGRRQRTDVRTLKTETICGMVGEVYRCVSGGAMTILIF